MKNSGATFWYTFAGMKNKKVPKINQVIIEHQGYGLVPSTVGTNLRNKILLRQKIWTNSVETLVKNQLSAKNQMLDKNLILVKNLILDKNLILAKNRNSKTKIWSIIKFLSKSKYWSKIKFCSFLNFHF